MTGLRVFVSYEATDATFAIQLMTDLRDAGAEVMTDRVGAVGIVPCADPTSTDFDDAIFEQFLHEELPYCQQLIVVQTPEALQSQRVQGIVDAALKHVQEGRMTGVSRVIAPTLNAVEAQDLPPMWATIPEFDASQDSPRALVRLRLHLGLTDLNDIPDTPASALSMPPVDLYDLKEGGDKPPVADPFHAQRLDIDRPLRSPSVPLSSRFIIISLVMALVLVVAGAAVFMFQGFASGKSTLAATKSLVPTPTTIYMPTSTPIPTRTPTPTPTPTRTPIPAPIIVPTSPPMPPPTPKPTQVVPTCTGLACDGKSPRGDHGPHGVPCWNDGANVVASQPVPYGVVYLWHSNGCGTNWSETLQTGNTSYIANANITRNSDNRHYDGTWYASDVWSPMVYTVNTTANACGSVNNASGGCSGFH